MVEEMEGLYAGVPPRRAGQYASERYSRGLRRFRRRFYREIGVALVAIALGELLLALLLDSFVMWMGFAFVAGGVAASIWILSELPPDHIRRWGDGAWGERQTARALEPLEAAGWKVKHDIELEQGGNIDHIAESPTGKRFLLETKTLSGTVTVDAGCLTCIQVDDPEQIYKHVGLRNVLLARARLVYGERPRGWVQAAVVIWGDFPQRLLEDGKLVYVHGDELSGWLRNQAA
jgi:hypothetical protein